MRQSRLRGGRGAVELEGASGAEHGAPALDLTTTGLLVVEHDGDRPGESAPTRILPHFRSDHVAFPM